jgi:hypothetical protein
VGEQIQDSNYLNIFRNFPSPTLSTVISYELKPLFSQDKKKKNNNKITEYKTLRLA